MMLDSARSTGLLLLFLVVLCAGMGYYVGRGERNAVLAGDTTVQRVDFIGRCAILILLMIAALGSISYFASPQQWEFVNRILDLLDRSLFLILGFLIRDKQDVLPASAWPPAPHPLPDERKDTP